RRKTPQKLLFCHRRDTRTRSFAFSGLTISPVLPGRAAVLSLVAVEPKHDVYSDPPIPVRISPSGENMATQNLAEEQRLREARELGTPWKQWGPYLSERQWGTVREDYSQDGNAWDYFSHDQSRSRA